MRKQFTVVIALAALFAVSQLPAQTSRTADVQFKAAQHKEQVEGDLKGAIEQYKKLAENKDRVIAAKALIQMAECYQKLGDAESQKIYQRIVRDYKDQKDALALAQARLGGTPDGSTKGDRAVWTGPSVDPYGRVSPDGRFITYVDWNNGSLMVRDVAVNVDRALTPPVPDSKKHAENSVISRDGKQVVYVWYGEDKPAALHIAALQGSGYLNPREIFLANEEVGAIGSIDLSPDGKWIAADIRRKNRTHQIARIAVADGSLRVLNSLNTEEWRTIFFSPDSKYIAYAARGANQERDVFVVAIDGSGEIAAGVHGTNEVMGWSPDGTRLMFSSDRTGSMGLWALPFSDGKAQGEPELLKPDIGSDVSLGLTASGTLYVYKKISTRDIVIAPIDLEAGKLLGPPVSFNQGFVKGVRGADWSPDGNYLAYPVTYNHGCMAVRSVATGEVRLLAPTLMSAETPSWSPDGRSLLAKGHDLRGREGIFQIDVQSGGTSVVILSDGLTWATRWSADGKKVYFRRSGAGGEFERDLASGSEKKVPTGNPSPDGQYVGLTRQDASTKTFRLLVAPYAGGEPRELLRLTQPEVFESSTWTPDSSAMIVQKSTGSRSELWLVPVTGGRPRKLDIDPHIWMEGSARKGEQGFSLSPDGHRIAFQMGKSVSEVWALENFLPAPAARK